MTSRKQNVGLNVGTNVGLNDTERRVIALLLEGPDSTADEMATAIGVTKRTVERTMKKLQDNGLVVRVGSKKSGHWIVIR